MSRNREKKGVSTVIVAVFMIAVIVLGLGLLTSGLAFQNKLGQVVTETTLAETEQIKERIELRDVSVVSNKFNITLANTGILPVKIVRAWVTNTTDTNGWHKQYDNLNKLINPGQVLTNFGQDLSLIAKTDKSYEIKVVTERGTTAVFKITNGNDAKLHVRLVATPNTIPSGQRVTITMLVTHNNTLADAVVNIEPEFNPPTPNIDPPGTGTATLVGTGPTPAKDASIIKGGTRSYTWVYEITGQNNTQFTFTGRLKGEKSNTDSVTFSTRLVKITATEYATTAGILTINYTTFRYTQQSSAWTAGWTVDNDKVAFKMDLTNNNVSGTFWISKYTMFDLDPVGSAADTPWYITNKTNDGGTPPDPPDIYQAFKCPAYNGQFLDEYCLSVPQQGTLTLYFAGDAPNALPGPPNPVPQISSTGKYYGFIMIYGKFCNAGAAKDCSGTKYAQNLPFMAIEAL